MTSVLIIGTGPVALSTARYFVETGHSVAFLARTPREVLTGTTLHIGDAASRVDLAAALDASGAGRIVCCAHAPYSEKLWRERLLPIEEAVLSVAADRHVHVSFPESVYAFGSDAKVVSRHSRPLAREGKPGIRAELIARRQASGAQTCSVVASDLYGPGCGSSMIAHALFIDPVSHGRRPMALMSADIPHPFTFIGDYAQALGEASLQKAEAITIAPTAQPISQREFAALTATAFGVRAQRPITIQRWMLQLAGRFNPDMAGLVEMTWLFNSPRSIESSYDWRPVSYEEGLARIAAS